MAKQKFKITNWPSYNKALRQRGSLTVWLDESAIAAWTENTAPEHRGRPLHYTDMAITTVLMMKRVFNLSLRPLQGFVDSIFQLMGVALVWHLFAPIIHWSANVQRPLISALKHQHAVRLNIW